MIAFPPASQARPGKAWMITFVDLMAICVSFFVLLHAMTAPKPRGEPTLARGDATLSRGEVASPGIGAADTLDRALTLIRTALGNDAVWAAARRTEPSNARSIRQQSANPGTASRATFCSVLS